MHIRENRETAMAGMGRRVQHKAGVEETVGIERSGNQRIPLRTRHIAERHQPRVRGGRIG